MTIEASPRTLTSDNQALKQKAAAVVESAAELGAEAKEYASHRLQEVKHGAAGMIKTSREKLSGANEAIIDYVQENPVKSIAIAVGLGFLAGYLISRR